ncbi:hypothetical protein AHF37_08765 [Paragonimus kellicotti]|nr:hypothetical protein AHF37_08765 [Paragonimus kellicotti]
MPVSSTCRKYVSHPNCKLANEHRFIYLPGRRYHTHTHTQCSVQAECCIFGETCSAYVSTTEFLNFSLPMSMP